MENTENNSGVQLVGSDSLSLLTKAEIDIQISTAKAFPRSLTEFQRRAMSMATYNEEIAALCCYAVPRDGKTIEGPSVRLAEIVCASYGNIRAGHRTIANDGKAITAQGICHDLETNNSVTVEVKRRITKKDGRTFSEDMQTTTGNAAGAIAYRNAVFKVVPMALIQDVYEKAKEVARGTAETLVKRRDKALEYFKSIGVKDEQICAALNLKSVGDIDLDKLFTLTSMRSAIKNGESTVKSLFEAVTDEISLEDLKELFNAKKEVMDAKGITEAERIINTEEKNSYKKLNDKLKKL